MADTNVDLLRIEGADDFINGTQASTFNLEEGFYDQCKVCGWVIETANFNDHERKLFSLIWQIKNDDKVYTKKGKGWSLPLSNNEKATFRIDLLKWFNKNTWPDVCDVLLKGGILVKDADGSATFKMDNFFGKFGRLCLKEKTSQKGTKYTLIDSISPAKKKEDFQFDEVPEFLVKGDSIVAYKLADGVKIRVPEAKTETAAKPTAEPQPQPKVTQVDAKDFLAQSNKDDDLPFN